MAAAQALKERGNGCFARKQYAEAAIWYGSAIEAAPGEAALWSNRAAALAALEKWEEALADARHSVQLDATWAKGHFRTGTALLALRRPAEAVAALEAGAAVEPFNVQMRDALAQARAALADEPADAEDAKARGNAAFRDGRLEDAIAWYTRSVALSGDAAEPAATALSNRSECHRQLGAPAQAADDATEALRRAPGHAKARLRRAAALETMERFAEAYEDFRAVLDADPGAAVALAGMRRTRGVLSTAAAAASSDRRGGGQAALQAVAA